MLSMLKKYLQVTKPGIIFGNLISMIGGFLLASKGVIDYSLLVFTLVSLTMIVASSCIFNNYIDRDIDKKMERTKNRVLVKGLIPPFILINYAILLGFLGFILMWFRVNPLSCLLGIFGFVVYVGLYSLYMKRRSIYATLFGSLSGAMPPVIGYCAVSNVFDIGALSLLAIFILWQIPHSYSIAILHYKDYQIANVPVLPVVKGISVTKNYIIVHIMIFAISVLIPSLIGFTGYRYIVVSMIMIFYWLCIALRGKKVEDNKVKVWAYHLFISSIVVITSISVMISVDFIVHNTHYELSSV